MDGGDPKPQETGMERTPKRPREGFTREVASTQSQGLAQAGPGLGSAGERSVEEQLYGMQRGRAILVLDRTTAGFFPFCSRICSLGRASGSAEQSPCDCHAWERVCTGGREQVHARNEE